MHNILTSVTIAAFKTSKLELMFISGMPVMMNTFSRSSPLKVNLNTKYLMQGC